MVFRRVLRLQRQRGLLRNHFQKSADSVETFRNNKRIAGKQRQRSKANGEGFAPQEAQIGTTANLLDM